MAAHLLAVHKRRGAMTIQEVKDRWSPGMKDPAGCHRLVEQQSRRICVQRHTNSTEQPGYTSDHREADDRTWAELAGCRDAEVVVFPLHWSSWEPVPQALIFHRE